MKIVDQTDQPAPGHASGMSQAHAWVHKALMGWPQTTQGFAIELIGQYGLPQELGARRIAWYHNGPWKRTVLYRDTVTHNFPVPHQDVIEQTVNYRVPAEKVSDLVSYNGSLLIDRTCGELSCRCDSEAANTLSLNIADDIVKGERTVDQALGYHAQVFRGMQIGESEPYPKQLRFKTGETKTADPGEEAPLLKHLGD